MEIKTCEMHTGGEPVRIIVEGIGNLLDSASTILEKRRLCQTKYDHIRRLLMSEPRGHADMYGVIPVAPNLPEADLAVLFMHNEGYSTMCGHATIALGRWAVDTGRVKKIEPETPVNIQCPCGLVRAFVRVNNGISGRVRFLSVPSFVSHLQKEITVDGLGSLLVDVAYGGAFYAFVRASDVGLDIFASPIQKFISVGMAIKAECQRSISVVHDEEPDLAFFYGTIFLDDNDADTSKPTANICIFADGQLDRSPTGSGVSARIALMMRKGIVTVGQPRVFQSRVKSEFTGTAAEVVSENPQKVVVEVEGHAYYTGTSAFTLEEGDELGKGFLL